VKKIAHDKLEEVVILNFVEVLVFYRYPFLDINQFLFVLFLDDLEGDTRQG
jgi:hypothetical protein